MRRTSMQLGSPAWGSQSEVRRVFIQGKYISVDGRLVIYGGLIK